MCKTLPKRCVDPVMKYCQGCEYGYIIYPDDVESSRDLEGCFFESGCIFGLENTVPTAEELQEFEKWCEENDINGKDKIFR